MFQDTFHKICIFIKCCICFVFQKKHYGCVFIIFFTRGSYRTNGTKRSGESWVNQNSNILLSCWIDSKYGRGTNHLPTPIFPKTFDLNFDMFAHSIRCSEIHGHFLKGWESLVGEEYCTGRVFQGKDIFRVNFTLGWRFFLRRWFHGMIWKTLRN